MNLTDLMHGEKFIGRFYYIFHGSWLIKQLTLPLQQHYLNSFLIKLRRKTTISLQTSKQSFAIYFPIETCNFCPTAIPEIFSQTQGSDYWQLIHFNELHFEMLCKLV